jgi:hypothetical protein
MPVRQPWNDRLDKVTCNLKFRIETVVCLAQHLHNAVLVVHRRRDTSSSLPSVTSSFQAAIDVLSEMKFPCGRIDRSTG